MIRSTLFAGLGTRRLRADRRAVSAVEFALCLPFLATLYLGGYQLSDAISAYRKVTFTTRTIADLTSQYTSVTDTDLDTILNASQQVMSPYKTTNASMTISQIKIDSGGTATVDWSRGKNISGLTAGTAFSIPSSIRTPGTYLIVAAVNYNYVPVVASSLIGTIPMQDTIILSPRAVPSITKRAS